MGDLRKNGTSSHEVGRPVGLRVRRIHRLVGVELFQHLQDPSSTRDALAATFGDNKATIALFGPSPALQTVGGFTVFKVSMTLMIAGAIWGPLTSSRLLRGEEDTGRWDILLSGWTTRGGAAMEGLGGFAVSAVVLWALTSLITSIAGVSSKVGIARPVQRCSSPWRSSDPPSCSLRSGR